ncbi:MAG: energy transducer TonB [Allomuricauda sp.]
MKSQNYIVIVFLLVFCVQISAAIEKEPTVSKEISADEIFEIRNLDTEPKLIKKSKVKYPPKLFKEGISGTVVLQITVNTKGRAQDIKVESSPHELCSEAAIESVKKWRFKPATINNKPVKCRIRLPLSFSITK